MELNLKNIQSSLSVNKESFESPREFTTEWKTTVLDNVTKNAWKENLMSIQSDLAKRITWYRQMLKCISQTNPNWDDLIAVKQNESFILGMGSYGFVFQGLLNKPLCNLVPFAVKVQQYSESEDDVYEEMKHEVNCLKKANELFLNGNPHFVATYAILERNEIDVSTQRNIKSTYFLQEFANGDLESLLKKQSHSSSEIFGYFFQIVNGILEMARRFGMTHRDLYPKNILYNHTTPFAPHMSLSIRNQNLTYFSAPTSVLLKISDFGLCRADDVQGQYFTQDKKWSTIFSLFCNSAVHLDLPIYATDLITVVTYLFDVNKTSMEYSSLMLTNYFIRVLHALQTYLNNPDEYQDFLQSPSSLEEFVVLIFSKEFMTSEFQNLVQFKIMTQIKE